MTEGPCVTKNMGAQSPLSRGGRREGSDSMDGASPASPPISMASRPTSKDENPAPSRTRGGHWEGPATRRHSSASRPYSPSDHHGSAYSPTPYRGKVRPHDARQHSSSEEKMGSVLFAEGRRERRYPEVSSQVGKESLLLLFRVCWHGVSYHSSLDLFVASPLLLIMQICILNLPD